MNTAALPPFSCSFDANFPRILSELGCSLMLTTYQAGKLVLLSPQGNDRIAQLPRSFPKPMGIGLSEDQERLALATQDELLLFGNSAELAQHYPKKPGVYDRMYVPRAAYYTNALDLHDVHFGSDGIYAVNTLFSCIVKVDEHYSFTPVWKPPFVPDLQADDYCHLNGLVMRNGQPAYATAFGQGSTRHSWRESLVTSGILMDIQSNRIICDGLGMPHSPKYVDGWIYLLLSAEGKLARINPSNGKREDLWSENAFLRGLAFSGEYIFIGCSRLRKESSSFSKLPIAQAESEAGIFVVHRPTFKTVARLQYKSSVEEIYDLGLLAGSLRPNILNNKSEEYKGALVIPDATYWSKP